MGKTQLLLQARPLPGRVGPILGRTFPIFGRPCPVGGGLRGKLFELLEQGRIRGCGQASQIGAALVPRATGCITIFRDAVPPPRCRLPIARRAGPRQSIANALGGHGLPIPSGGDEGILLPLGQVRPGIVLPVGARLISIGGALVAVGNGLVHRGCRLVGIGECLVGVCGRLI